MWRGTSTRSCPTERHLPICSIVPTRWVLCDIQLSAAQRGFVHGHLRLFAEDGTLMATASQSLVLRYRKG